MEIPPTLKANAAEREANSRVAAAADRVRQAEVQSDQAINNVRDQYEKQYLALNSRQSLALESEKLKGYEQVRDQQHAHQAELRKLRREGDTDEAKTREYYRNALYAAESKGKEDLNAVLQQANHRMEYEQKNDEIQMQEMRSQHEHGMNLLRDEQEGRMAHIRNDYKREYEKLKEETEEANAQAETKFKHQHADTVQRSKNIIETLENNASHQIKSIRQNTADKLSAYRTRQSDPFYQMMTMDSSFHEDAEGYTLVVKIPEHEQKHLSASVKGDNLVISGNRKNEEQLEVEPGHTVGSSSFQSFHESYPLSWPVEASRITREQDGEWVTIRVPKKNQYAFKEPEIRKPEKARVEAPHFPENLPKIHHVKEDDEVPPKPVHKEPGWGTLS